MVSGLQSAAAAMHAQGERLTVLANNLANVTAAGYKADHPEFFQLLTSPRAAGLVSPTSSAAPPELPGEVQTRTEFSTGPLRETSNVLDFALEGRGFFVVRTEGGERLTRAGAFTRSAEGLLTTPDGAAVLGADSRPIALPERGRVDVDEQGNLSVDGSQIASLRLVDVQDLARLSKEGGTRFVVPADLELTPAQDVTVRQGAIELSNVNPILTLVEMIDALRVYEAAQRSARSVDDTLRRAVNEVGRAS